MEIEFQGAARTVTGSMHVVRANGKTILLDCGLYQGHRDEANRRNREFPFDPRSIDAIVLSHAHIDHSGNIPGIVKRGFTGPVWCTPATKDLSAVMLADSAHIQVRDAEYLNKRSRRDNAHAHDAIEPLYTPGDADEAAELFRAIPYHRPTEILPGISIMFGDAGHIIGSATVVLSETSKGKTTLLGFTGDLGNDNLPIVRDPEFMGDVDWLICESTYGGKRHETADDREERIRVDIARAVERQGKVIMPAFSVGRTQNIVFTLHKLTDLGRLPGLPVFVDSPLAVNATDIFRRHPETFDEETRAHLGRNHDPFGFARLRYIRDVEESKKLNEMAGPCLIISASGMCEAGRILHHLANNIEDPRNMIAIVGYQAEGTLGKRLVDGAAEVRILGSVYTRRAEVVKYNSFSAHADHDGLKAYVGRFDRRRLRGVFLVHGDLERAAALRDDIAPAFGLDVEIPVRGEKFVL
jgi:metallo-beta-lactamase family protein